MSDEKSKLQEDLEKLDPDQFANVENFVKTERARRGGVTDDFDENEVRGLNDAAFEKWTRAEGRKYREAKG